MTKKLRSAFPACLIAALAFLLPCVALAQTDQTREAPLPTRLPDGVAVFGELVSIAPDYLVLRETKFSYAPNAGPGDSPTSIVEDRVIQIPEGTPITSATSAGLEPGARVFVGARESDGVLIALMINEVATLSTGQATDPEMIREALRIPIENAISSGTVAPPASNVALPNCAIGANGFTPGEAMLNFTGCYGGPSFTGRGSFSPVRLYGNGSPLFGIPDTFSISVTKFELNLGLAGWTYQFPFLFTAVDPAQEALDGWARKCLADYHSVEVGVCPLPRPWVPGPSQGRSIEVNVIPVDPSPAPIMNGGLGGSIGFEFTIYLATGCGATRLGPCYFTTWFDFGPFSQFQRAKGAPPLGPSEVLRGEANACLAVGGSLVLGFLGVPIGISTLISPFDVLYCQPWELYNQAQPGFTARISDALGGTVTDFEGTTNPRVAFTGTPRTLRLSPGNSGASSIRFQQFDYRLDWLTKLRLDLRSSFVTWFRGPEWNTGIVPKMPFVNTISPYIDTCGSGMVHQLDAPDFTGLQPVCIDIKIPQAEFGNASVKEFNPVAVSSEGGTKVRVTGTGFQPTYQPNGQLYPGTGVTRVVLHRADTNADQNVDFTIKSNTEIELTMPAHPPTLQVNDDGAFEHGTSVSLTFYAWGTTFYKGIYYAARPTVTNVTALDGVFTPEGTPPTGSEMGGERVALTGYYIGKVTDVYFGNTKADFVECSAGQTSPLCNGAPGGYGLYNAIVAIAPPGAGALPDCPAGQGTRCDHVKVRSACFGNDFAQGRPAPGAYCGLSLANNSAVYVRKRKPEITSLTPAGGPPGSDLQVTITGVGFAGYPRVKIGTTTSALICNAPGCPTSSDTQLVVTVPAAAVGTFQISVINPCPAAIAVTTRCGESDPVSFRHLNTPLVTNLSPPQGGFDGGTLITVTGQGFATATSVTIGGASVPFTLDATNPDTRLHFTTPRGYPDLVAGLPASVNVLVTVACGTAATTNANACGTSSPASFTYLPPEFRLASNISVAQITGEVGRPAPVSATLTTYEGVPLPNRTIKFSVLGVTLGSAVTNASGVASTTVMMPTLPTGAYAEQTVANFGGDSAYLPREAVNWLILTHAEVVAWGNPISPAAIDVPVLLQGVSAVSAGGYHGLALKNDGTVVGWGNPLYEFAPPAGLSGVVAISAGYAHSLALKSDHTVVKWGIGGGTLPLLPPIGVISAGQNVSAAITTSGDIVAWALSPTNPVLSNIPLTGGDPFVAVAVGASHAIALRQSGVVVTWGSSSNNLTSVPAGLSNVVAISASWFGNLALKGDGTVVGWGFACVGCTGPAYMSPPAGLTGVQAINAGLAPGRAGLARKSDGTLVSWYGGSYQALNAPAGYDQNVGSFSQGGDNGTPFFVVLRKPRLDTSVTVDPVTGFAGDPVTLRARLLTGTSPIELENLNFTLGGTAAGTGKTGVGLLSGIATKATTIPAIAPGIYATGVQAAFPTPALGLVGSSGSAQLLVRGHQTIAFDPLADRAFDPAPFEVSAAASSSLAVSLAAAGACSIDGNFVTLIGLGTCTITASQAGDVVYTAAPSVPRSFTVLRANQSITFDPLVDRAFGAPPAIVLATATSRLPVILTSLTPNTCSAIANRVTNLTRGVCVVAADQAGSANYFAAARLIRSFSITLDAFDLSRLPSQLDPPNAAIAAGTAHSCALAAAGSVKCWGNNEHGQLGDGTTTTRRLAVDVAGLGGSATMLAAGGAHTCAVLVGGSVKCWGANGNGELGNNSTDDASIPVAVSGLTGVVGLTAGASHTCALTSAGQVRCWGANARGQLGNNSTAASLIPAEVSGPGGAGSLSSAVAIAAGGSHTCAVGATGGVHCWGAGDDGQLGADSTGSSIVPQAVAGPGGSGLVSGIASISAGASHTCALSSGGVPYCWGRNSSGQLGDGTTLSWTSPKAVSEIPGRIASVAAGGDHTCLVTVADGVKCWGSNANGQIGDGSTSTRLAPVLVSGLAFGAASLAAGGNHTCALTTTGGVKCWGSNGEGQLGNNTTADQTTSIDVPGLSAGVAQAGLGFHHACALTPAGGVQCWGLNDHGQLGDGTTISRPTPGDVAGLESGVTAIASGSYHTCALTDQGAVKCWGWNPSGALGDGGTLSRVVPTDVVGLGSGVARIAAGDFHTCAFMTAGAVKCWGNNAWGQLGDSSLTNRSTPVDLTAPIPGVVSLTAGANHNCVLTAGGAVKCWGRNSSGQLGDGTTALRSTPPVDVAGLTSDVLGIGAGADHTCAFLAEGTKCWGNNADGQLGDGSVVTRLSPVDLSANLEGVSGLALGGNNTCAMTEEGAVKCWGRNLSGQLGDGTTNGRSEATVMVAGLGAGAGGVSGADGHNCAVTSGGGLQCWGKNEAGQIGDGSTLNRLTPVNVRGGQSIYLVAPAVVGLQQPVSLEAVVTSGLPLTFESLTPSICTVGSANLIGVASGLCAVRVLQPGDGSHAAAPPQLRLVVVVALPTVTSPSASAITESTALLGGTVTAEGGAPVTSRGVVWAPTATNPNPSIGGAGVTQVSTSGATGAFTVAATGLSSATGYSFKAWASSALGVGYSSTATFTSAAPFVCPTIVLGALSNAMAGGAYPESIAASGGSGPYTYDLTSGALPSGLSLVASGASAGSFTGTIGATGDFTFQVTATDTGAPVACVGSRSYTVRIGSAIAAGDLVIREFRARGPLSATDEYLVIANRTAQPLTVMAVDGSAGFGIAAQNAGPTCPAGSAQVLASIPNGTVIKAGGFYLAAHQTDYSLASYGGTGAAGPDVTWTADLCDGSGIGLFRSSSTLSSATVLDAVGFAAGSTGPYLEGAGLAGPTGGIVAAGQHAFVRRAPSRTGGEVRDTGDNVSDFFLVSIDAAMYSGIQSALGTPGPRNRTSPAAAALTTALTDQGVGPNSAPNRIQSGNYYYFRRLITNDTGAPITRLRLRLVDIATLYGEGYNPSAQADWRGVDSTDLTLTLSSGATAAVKGLTVEAPTVAFSATGKGAGYNASFTVNLAAPLANGSSLHVNIGMRNVKGGTFYFMLLPEFLN